MRRSVVASALALSLALCARAQADEAWPVEWTVDGTGEVRRLAPRPGGQVRLELIAGETGPARVDGPAAASPELLDLRGELVPSAGVIGALEGRDAPPPVPVQVTVSRRPTTRYGELRARATVRVGGRIVAREAWSAPGPAQLEVVALEGFGGGGLDPTKEVCRVRVRVLGRAQTVTLRAQVPPGAGDGRREFYRAEGVDPRAVATVGPVRLAPGEHVVEWDGRDDGPAGRIALPGTYALAVQSSERAATTRRPVTAEVGVSRPRARCFEPRFEFTYRFPVDALDRLRTDLSTRYTLAGTRTRVDRDAFLAALGDAAVGVIATHGHPAGFSLGDWRAPAPRLDAEHLQGKPLRDVHSVFLFSCKSGARDEDGHDLARALVAAGVDVVVLSTETLLIAEARPYHDAIGVRLLGYGHPIARAARDAAKFSYDQVWEAATPERRAAWLAHPERIRPLVDALRVVTAEGVDPAEERLVPARYGRATN